LSPPPKADIEARLPDVRFTPKSGHWLVLDFRAEVTRRWVPINHLQGYS